MSLLQRIEVFRRTKKAKILGEQGLNDQVCAPMIGHQAIAMSSCYIHSPLMQQMMAFPCNFRAEQRNVG